MSEKKNIKSTSKRKTAALIALGVLALLVAAFFVYTGRYYRADDTARAALASDGQVRVEREKAYFLFDGPGEGTAYIFYPGAKVETESYAPLMRSIAQSGIDVYLVDMPFRLAFFGMNRASAIMEANPQVASWYIGGHSLGGAMAASYAADHTDRLDGAILMAAYPTKSLDAAGFRVLSFYGTEDLVLNKEHFEAGRKYMPQDYLEYEIQGGSHAQFGNYGAQKGDGTPAISAQSQQEFVTNTIAAVLKP